MSKQYLTTHTVDHAHVADIFSVATTPTAVLSGSGASDLKIHDTSDPDFPLTQTLTGAHRTGCHHIATARGGTGTVAASAGFAGEVKIWHRTEAGDWKLHWELQSTATEGGGDVWAIALSNDEQYLACTTHDGHICVWDLPAQKRIQQYETGTGGAGSYGMAIDLSRDGRLTASGHQSGAVYVFNNESGRLIYSLSGLAKPVQAVAFTPLGTRLAAAGNAGVIAIYDMQHGEHIGNLVSGTSSAWILSLDFSDTGEYLLSGHMDGKVKVWSIERGICVATHSETDKALWSVRWLPKGGRGGDPMKGESFCTAGSNTSITFYREATGS